MKNYDTIVDIAINRGFFMPSFEIYGGISGFYDFGPNGFLMKNKIIGVWRKIFVKKTGYLEISSNSLSPEIVFEASGHLKNFTDPIVVCSKCHAKKRPDKLLEKKLGKQFDGLEPEEYDKLLKQNNIKCECGGEFLPTSRFNLMFETKISNSNTAYLRPETAQNIYMNFKRIHKLFSEKIPMGIAQVGKAYRNEISPRKGLIRLREFEQMDVDLFYNPNKKPVFEFKDYKIRFMDAENNEHNKKISELVEEKKIDKLSAYFISLEMEFYEKLIDLKKIRFRELAKNERPHYSSLNIDVEVELETGKIELLGNAERQDYDLSSHSKYSKKDLRVYIEEEKQKIFPHIFEVSMGLERLFWAILELSFREKTEEKNWYWFDFNPIIAPYTAAVFPLVKKDGLLEIAEKINKDLINKGIDSFFSKSGSIGRRYARADEIGVPYCVTIDYQTKEDNTITLRFRNTGRQERIKINELKQRIEEYMQKGIVE